MSELRRAVYLPHAPDLDLVQRLDADGFESLWTEEGQGRTAFGKLTRWASVTESVGLGTCIVNVFSRTPAALAQEAATLDEFSDGRAILGLGVAHPGVVEDFHGVEFDRPLARMEEYIRLVRRYLAGDPEAFDGEFFTPTRTTTWSAFEPVRSEIPIYNAALGPSNLRLTGEFADGWLPAWYPLDGFDEARANLATGAERADRDLSDIDVARYVPVAVSDDPSTARFAVAERIARTYRDIPGYYDRVAKERGFEDEVERARAADTTREAAEQVSDEFIDLVSVAGAPETVRDREQAMVDASVDLVIYGIGPVLDDDELRRETLDAIAPS
ncbi:LLM class flavin-dependent oxidoreductase [Haloarculaceae archaeon H-GB1-1]|nr:LLM class flavin-dependent oxidoreductase [Haloarculaceae archaeon H-GB1-1]